MRLRILQKGETLIEALGALAIISIVIVGVATSVLAAISNTKNNENQTLSTKYAQQGLEDLRQIRNQNYVAFKTYVGLYCFGKGQTTLGSPQAACSTPNFDRFIRSITIEQTPGCSANVAKVSVTVAFTDGKCSTGVYCHKNTQISCLSTVNPVSGP